MHFTDNSLLSGGPTKYIYRPTKILRFRRFANKKKNNKKAQDVVPQIESRKYFKIQVYITVIIKYLTTMRILDEKQLVQER